jgi:HEAT repeat protein
MTHRERLARLETLHAAAADGRVDALRQALADEDWEVVQGALFALRRAPRPELGAQLLAVFDREDRRDLYGQPEGDLLHFGAGDPRGGELSPRAGQYDAETLEAWKCRWRVKQAAALAVAALAEAGGPRALPDETVDRLIGYLQDAEGEDYPVRAAAAQALGALGDPRARAALETAAGDVEFCTATEASKALARLA